MEYVILRQEHVVSIDRRRDTKTRFAFEKSVSK